MQSILRDLGLGRPVAISSPYSRRGALWQAYKAHYGKDGDPVLVWQADTASMNPTVDPAIIAAAYDADESAASAEYGALFRRDLEAFVSREAVEAATVPGRLWLPPVGGLHYFAFSDPSGGGQDSFALAIGHAEERDGTRVVVVDYLCERRRPFNPDVVVREFAAALKSYQCARVQADKTSPGSRRSCSGWNGARRGVAATRSTTAPASMTI